MMMSLSNDVEQWRSELHLRLKNFKRDIFFELTRTLNREWWASQIENWEVCEERIDSLLGATVQVDHGMEQTGQRIRPPDLCLSVYLLGR